MKNMIKHIFPTEFFTGPTYFRALTLGVLYLGVAIAQLFSFEKFAGVTSGFSVPGGQVAAVFIAVVLPVIEIAALPFLLSMRLSERWRRVSRYFVALTPMVWLVLSLWQNFSPSVDKSNTGIFGATIVTSVGFWSILFTALWLWAAILVIRELPPRAKAVEA